MKALCPWYSDGFADNFSIKELGLKLSSEQRSIIKRRLQSLEASAPALSHLKLTFHRTNNGIKGYLAILSYEKNFRAVCSGENPVSIYDELEKGINAQLRRWKQERFKNQILVTPLSSSKGQYKEA